MEGYAEIRVAVMQKPHYDNDGGQLSPLLQTGWEAFKVCGYMAVDMLIPALSLAHIIMFACNELLSF